jgi:CheY-like chemotaxis protein
LEAHLPTILVADDNSNIQKMVTLAVRDLGVEVVSVANGEAAVRKLAAFLPDLVLADIFMPVRNGYEVCEFVKHDVRLSHIPVVLLAGAFDPFDEREAERVGADGVLKKPFMPPDPLIGMVKALLDRASVPIAAPASASPQAAPLEAPQPSAPSVARVIEMPPPAREDELAQEEPEEDARPAQPATFDEDSKRFVFSRFFTPGGPNGGSEKPAESPANLEEVRTWNRSPSQVDTSLLEPPAPKVPADREWEAEAPVLPRRDDGSYFSSTGLEDEAPAETPVEPRATSSAGQPQEEIEAPPVAHLWRSETQEDAPAALAPEGVAPVVESSLLGTPLVLEPEVEASLPPATSEAPLEFTAPHSEDAPSAHAEEANAAPARDPDLELSPAAMDSAPVDLPPSQQTAPPLDLTSFAGAPKPLLAYPGEPVQSFSVPPPPDPILVEAVVKTVIERLQPQILDIVTREILRPVIEALVRREFEKR